MSVLRNVMKEFEAREDRRLRELDSLKQRGLSTWSEDLEAIRIRRCQHARSFRAAEERESV